ncbi:MAG: efflux RND transporter periplasmic adaptor subunit [candidate division Zixibacteria bacterium]|nr:efflux RND transporter periplasmic adaptor subunit [candidate division Zixibacteria bacterium]
MSKKIVLTLVAVVIVAAGVFLVVSNGSASKDEGPKTVAVEKGSIIDKALAVGRIEPKKQIAVKSKVGGLARRIFVEVGDSVNIGDPLFDIAPDPTPIEFAEAKRQVELSEVTFANVKREFERSQTLNEKQLISHQEFESKRAQYEECELRLKLANEKLALIESGSAQVADREVDNIIKSSINGTVLAIEVEEGDPVVPLTSYQSGTELMTLAYMEDLIFKGNVDEIDVGKLHQGMEAEIEIGAIPGKKVIGELTKISPRAHQEDGSTLFEVEIIITDPGEHFLRAGYSANADIMITKREDILLIPERLITTEDSVSTCEIQDSLGVISKREIETGLSDGINMEVVSGLEEGELIVERPPREIKPWD